MFDEAGQWDWEYVQADSEQVSGSFTVEYLVLSSRCTVEEPEE
jgi:hypothetical protein